jgi:hypothetical protein
VKRRLPPRRSWRASDQARRSRTRKDASSEDLAALEAFYNARRSGLDDRHGLREAQAAMDEMLKADDQPSSAAFDLPSRRPPGLGGAGSGRNQADLPS